MFSRTYLATLNAIIISKSLYILVLLNPIEIPLVIKQRMRLGIIHEYATDKAFFVIKKANAFKALMMGAALKAEHLPDTTIGGV